MSAYSLLQTADDFRPIPFYFITTGNPENLSAAAALRQMTVLRDSGFGGCVFFNKPPFGFTEDEFLSTPWFEAVRHFAEAARSLRLALWINDGFDFPPGDAGGRIRPLAPELKQRRLTLDAQGNPMVKEVPWGFPAFEEPESSRLFIELVYESHRKQVGEYFGNGITGFFSDADCRRVNFEVSLPNSSRRDYFPWSRNFPALFRKEYGYEIEPFLKSIVARQSCRAAGDYWRLSGKLYAQWFANNYEWCRRHGLKYTFHTSDSGPFAIQDCLRSSIYSEARVFDIAKHCDYPGTDHELLRINGATHFWGTYYQPRVSWGGDAAEIRSPSHYRTRGDVRARQAASVAFLNGKRGAMCEMFASTNWGAAPSDLLEIAAWQVMQGITFIVPHAVHQSLRGETKYFAPPDLSPAGSLGKSMPEVNATLAKWCCLLSQGEPLAPLALLDTTERVWSGESDSRTFFDLCVELNRHPQGYVITDADGIRAMPGKFQAVINPDLALTPAEKALFAERGLPILGAEDIARLAEIVPCDVRYAGEGRPHFHRRRLADGQVLVAVANIEDGRLISGELTLGADAYSLELYPGGIAFFSPAYQEYRAPFRPTGERIALPLEMDVEWGAPNLLPLVRWIGQNGQVCTVRDLEQTFSFSWTSAGNIRELTLLAPCSWRDQVKGLRLDGIPLGGAKPTKIFDDDYLAYPVEHGAQPGMHELVIEKYEIYEKLEARLPWTERILLAGEFDVSLRTENPFYHEYARQYNLVQYIPEKASVCLGARTRRLRTDLSWTEQGHPFYSGLATYNATVTIPESWRHARLVLPQVGSVCELSVNDLPVEKRHRQPYLFDLHSQRGVCRLRIAVNNTLANALEGYRAASGILGGGFCVEWDDSPDRLNRSRAAGENRIL